MRKMQAIAGNEVIKFQIILVFNQSDLADKISDKIGTLIIQK